MESEHCILSYTKCSRQTFRLFYRLQEFLEKFEIDWKQMHCPFVIIVSLNFNLREKIKKTKTKKQNKTKQKKKKQKKKKKKEKKKERKQKNKTKNKNKNKTNISQTLFGWSIHHVGLPF